MILSHRPGISGPDSSKRRESRSNRIRRILREETHQFRSYHELTDRYPTGRWVELVVNEPGEECIDEKKLFRFLSNSKQSIGGVSNRDWWRRNVIWGFYHYWCRPESKVTKFYLFMESSVSELVLKTRLVKVVGVGSEVEVRRVERPLYPTNSEGYRSFINGHFPMSDDE